MIRPLDPLRAYQATGVGNIETELARLRSEGKRPTVLGVAPGGAGKTRIGLELAQNSDVTIWIAPSKDLVRQPVSRLVDLGWTDLAWYLNGKRYGPPDAALIVSTVQTLAAMRRAGKELPCATRVILDEARNHLARDWRKIPELYPAADIIGLDGSPVRDNGSGLGEQYQEVVIIAQPPELIEQGYMVPSRVIAPKEGAEALSDYPVHAWQTWMLNKRTLVFCRDKAHAEHTAQEFNAVGVPARCLTDQSPTEERARILGDGHAPGLFALGAVKVVTCALLLRQGIDIPETEGVILARAFGSLSAFLQAIWRGSRPCPSIGKRENVVVDLYGAVHEHLHPDWVRPWPLAGINIGMPVDLPPLVQCKSCGAWGTGGACTALLADGSICGVRLPPPPPPRVLAKDMAEYRNQVDTPEDKQARLVKFVKEELKAGHNPYRAKHRYRGTYTVNPTEAKLWEAINQGRRELGIYTNLPWRSRVSQ